MIYWLYVENEISIRIVKACLQYICLVAEIAKPHSLGNERSLLANEILPI
jgi:hypothetical protein